MATWEVGEVRRSWGGETEMEQSREKTSLGRVLGERLEQVFWHDLALGLDITVEVYLLNRDIVLAVFFITVCLCKCLSAFRDGIWDFRRPPSFSRAVDAAERNGRSGSIIEEFGKGVGGFRKRECCKVGGRRAVGINISKVIVPASIIIVK